MKRPMRTQEYNNQRPGQNVHKQHQQSTSHSYMRDHTNSKPIKGKTPLRNGQQTRCNICQSINQLGSQWPDRSSEEVTYMVHELMLKNSNDLALQTLLTETWCCAVLDSGASSTVCGITWFQEYLDNLSTNEIADLKYSTSNKPFRIGDGREACSSKTATVPVNFGPHKTAIKTDTVDANTLLLPSSSSMKKAQKLLNFDNNEIIFDDSEILLETTANGLNALPIPAPKQLINKFNNNNN